MVIDNCNLKQTVYMYQCENSTLVIKGKVNSITLGKLYDMMSLHRRRSGLKESADQEVNVSEKAGICTQTI